MYFNDPVEFEEFLAPVGGEVLIRPAIGSLFNAEIYMQRLEHVGLFVVAANSFRVIKEPEGYFYGVTIPLSAPFTVLESGRKQTYATTSAHLYSPGRPFDCTAKYNCHFLVCNFFVESIVEYSNKTMQTEYQELPLLNSDISIYSQAGSNLLRSVAKTWSAINSKLTANEILLTELEDDLLASFVLQSKDDNFVKQDDPYPLSRAEDYISNNLKNPITRDQLAEVSSRSIRTLSRAFEKKYGMGPMAFIKNRRLDSAYLDLLRAKPDATSVTQVALNYGFAHVGKFAIEYGKAFGESPSVSLAR